MAAQASDSTAAAIEWQEKTSFYFSCYYEYFFQVHALVHENVLEVDKLRLEHEALYKELQSCYGLEKCLKGSNLLYTDVGRCFKSYFIQSHHYLFKAGCFADFVPRTSLNAITIVFFIFFAKFNCLILGISYSLLASIRYHINVRSPMSKIINFFLNILLLSRCSGTLFKWFCDKMLQAKEHQHMKI